MAVWDKRVPLLLDGRTGKDCGQGQACVETKDEDDGAGDDVAGPVLAEGKDAVVEEEKGELDYPGAGEVQEAGDGEPLQGFGDPGTGHVPHVSADAPFVGFEH